MKHIMDKEELLVSFARLTNANREYILAITRALTFAQNSTSNSLPLNDGDNTKSA